MSSFSSSNISRDTTFGTAHRADHRNGQREAALKTGTAQTDTAQLRKENASTHENAHESAPRYGRAFPIVTIILGVIGWFGSFELATEYIHVLKNPDYVPNCNFSPVFTCSSNMASWQGSVFGFSNTIIGLAAFVAPIILGIAMLGASRFRPWFWWCYLLGLFGGICFVFWLSWQSVFMLGTLCPWCMVVWTITIPLFWYSLTTLTSRGFVPLPDRARAFFASLHNWCWVLIIFSYLFIATEAQIGVNWILHVRLLFGWI